MEKVTHKGSLATITDFKQYLGGYIRIEVWFTTEATSANMGTYYNCNVYTKGKGCRNWIFQFKSTRALDERILDLISKEELYTAYYNHWVKLNPIRLFAGGSIDGELIHFSVKEKQQPTKHFDF